MPNLDDQLAAASEHAQAEHLAALHAAAIHAQALQAQHGAVQAQANQAAPAAPQIGLAADHAPAPAWHQAAPDGPFWMPAGATIHFATAGQAFAPLQTLNLESLYSMKPSTKTKKSIPKEEELDKTPKWHTKLDQYPKMTGDTPASERVCVVSGRKYKVAMNWFWRDPYWVASDYLYAFECRMVPIPRLGKWVYAKLAGKDMTTGNLELIEFMEKNGFVQLDESIWINSWQKKEHTFPFCASDDIKKERVGDATKIKNFQICHGHRKLFHSGEVVQVWVSPEEKKPFSTHYRRHVLKAVDCPNCGGVFVPELLVEHPVNAAGGKICMKCHDRILEESVIRHYDDNNFLPPMPDYENVKLRGKVVKTPKRRMFGVEVELGFDEGNRVVNALGVVRTMGKDFIYIKHDGSITKPEFKGHTKMGFEIVSAPAGMAVHRERWKALEHCPNFKTFRAWNTGTCGFHVHVSRDSLTQFQIGRILVFMNHEHNRYFIEVVAGRSENQYTKFIKKKLTDCDKKDDSKYMAVRTNKAASIEFRIFRGTVRYRHIMRNIEFCDAVCDFCAPCQSSLADMGDFRKFISFVEERRYLYPLLAEWLASIDLIAKKVLPRDNAHFKPIPIEEALSVRVRDQLASVFKMAKGHKNVEKSLAKCVSLMEEDKLNPATKPEVQF